MIRTIVEKHLIPGDEFVFGFADLHGLIHEKYKNFRYGVSIGKKLDDSIIDSLNDGPTLEYYKHYNKINNDLAGLTRKITSDLAQHNINAIAIEPTISFSSAENRQYLRTLTYDISHKMVATRAGLGWIGKTDLLVSFKFGPRLRLVSILTDSDPGEVSAPVDKSRCGKCRLCVKKCPAGAANGILWNINIHRDSFFDPYSCREKCGELAKQKLNVNERICGLCISVCPVGKIR